MLLRGSLVPSSLFCFLAMSWVVLTCMYFCHDLLPCLGPEAMEPIDHGSMINQNWTKINLSSYKLISSRNGVSQAVYLGFPRTVIFLISARIISTSHPLLAFFVSPFLTAILASSNYINYMHKCIHIHYTYMKSE
jgi:hypothetical protein